MTPPHVLAQAKTLLAHIDDLRDRCDAGDEEAREEFHACMAERHGTMSYCLRRLVECVEEAAGDVG